MRIVYNGEEKDSFNLENGFQLVFDFSDDEYISLSFSYKLSEILKQLLQRNSNGNIEIILGRNINQIELTAFSILLLIGKQAPNVQINFSFSNVSEAIKSKLLSFIYSASFTAGRLNITVNNGILPWNENRTSNWKYPSTTFLPIIYLDKLDKRSEAFLFDTQYFWKIKEEIFDNQITNIFSDFGSLHEVNPSQLNEKIYSHICQKLITNPAYNIFHFILLFYAKCLKELRTIYILENKKEFFENSTLFKEKFEKSYKQPFQSITSYSSYHKVLSQADNILKTKPPIFVLLYSFILNEYMESLAETDRNNKFIGILQKKIESTLALCENMTLGFTEIIRNIFQHSSTGKGALVFRIYNERDILSLKQNDNPDIIGYIEKLKNENEIPNRFFDINIFDISDIGIVDSYKSKLDNESRFTLKDLYIKNEQTPTLSVEKGNRSFGLLFFNGQVEASKGYFSVSTLNKNQPILFTSNKAEITNSNLLNGTCYNIVIPLIKNTQIKEERTEKEFFLEDEPVRGLENEVIKYKQIYLDQLDTHTNEILNTNDLIINIDFTHNQYESESDIQKNLIDKIKKYSGAIFSLKPTDIFVLHITAESKFISRNPGNLQRLIEDLYKTNIARNLILVLDSTSYLQNLMQSQLTSFLKFPVLIYYFDINYFKPFILANWETAQIIDYNQKHFTLPDFLREYVGKENQETSPIDEISLIESSIFYSKKTKIKEFDAIIQYKGITLFNYFLKTCLNTSVDESAQLNSKDKNFQGYKISDGHFRLGSSIHIKDFFYAKRLFQVSNIAYNISIQLCYYIKNNPDIFSLIKDKGIVLIGYAKYSEMLIFRLKRLLEVLVPDKSIEFNIFKDYESDKLLYETEHKELPCLIIVPISSTFSTSAKIKKGLQKNQEEAKNLQIAEPYINIINVADESFKDYLAGLRKWEDCKMLISNDWSEPDKNQLIKQEINIKGKDSSDPYGLVQKYFIQLFTNWYNTEECHLCFDEAEEPPLIETDKASVTPLLIFGEPIKYPPINLSLPRQTYLSKCHIYGHYRVDKKDNLHFIMPAEFLRLNRTDIETWLRRIKPEIELQIQNSSICIIAPDGRYNSKFVHLLNSELLGDAASIILFNAESDYISNFKEFYGDIIDRTKCIIYVDDQISTGRTFFSINQYLKSCNNRNFNYLFTMISRLNCNVLEELKSNLQLLDNPEMSSQSITHPLFYTFEQYNVPTVISSHLECPICAQEKNYKELAKLANLDPTEYYLYKKVQVLNSVSILPNPNEKKFRGYDTRIDEWKITYNKDHNEEAFLENPFDYESALKFCIEEYLHINLNSIITLISEDADDLFKNPPSLKEFIAHRLPGNVYEEEVISICFLKVISLAPFTNHYKIRRQVFRHLETSLIKELNAITVTNFDDKVFRKLKLYLKRLATLKSNFLIKKTNYSRLLSLYVILNQRPAMGRNIEELFKKRDFHIMTIVNYLTSNGVSCGTDKATLIKNINSESLAKIGDFQFSTAIAEVFYGKYYYRFKELSNEILIEKGSSPISVESVVFAARALKNIETVVKTRTDFHYYIATLIKEITKDNEVKSIYLEKELGSWFDSIEKKETPHIFRQLIRIIKLENIGILKRYSEAILKHLLSKRDFMTDQNSFKNYRAITKEKSKDFTSLDKGRYYEGILNDMIKEEPWFSERFSPLLRFLSLEKETSSRTPEEPDNKPPNAKLPLKLQGTDYSISDSFFHYTMLMWFLDSDEKGNNNTPWNLEEKIKFINDRIIDILQVRDESMNAEALAFVIYKQIEPGTDADEKVITTYGTNPSSIEQWKFQGSFVQKLFPGIKLRDGGGPQNIIEFKKENGKWKSLKRYYKLQYNGKIKEFKDDYNSDKKLNEGFLHSFFEGNELFKDKNHLLFYRITQMDYIEHEEPETENVLSKINIKPQAIVLVASNKANYYKPEKIRYLLLLKKYLSGFFKHHYENDSYSSAIIERSENSFYRHLSHGVEGYALTAFEIQEKIVKNYKKIIPLSQAKTSSEARELLSRNEQLENDFALYFDLSLKEVSLSRIIAENLNNHQKLIADLESKAIYQQKTTIDDITEYIKNAGERVAISRIKQTSRKPRNFFEPTFNIESANVSVNIHKAIVDVVFLEILTNIKKANMDEEHVKVDWEFSLVSDSPEKNYLKINAVNSCLTQLPREGQTGFGLKMIDKIIRNVYNGTTNFENLVSNKYLSSIKIRINEK